MTTDETSPQPSRLVLTPEEFGRRLAARGHAPDEIRRLWEELAAGETEAAAPVARLGFGPVIAVYIGLLLVVAASISLLSIYWNGLGAGGILAVTVAYLVAYLVAAEVLRRRGLPEPADVLEAVSIAWVAVGAYAVQELVGVWPGGADGGEHIHRGLTVIALVVIAAAALLTVRRPDPLLLVPIAAATALLAVDLAEAVFGERQELLGDRERVAFLLPAGVAWMATGLWLDVRGRRDFAAVAHWCGLVLTGFAVISLVPKTVPGFAVIGVLGAIAMFFSAFVRHWSYTIVGGFGVLMATTSSLAELGGLAPVLIAVVGIALIFVGLRWSRWRDSIRAAVLARLPAGTRDFVGRLAP